MEIRFIANDGFLIEISNKKILIDALFGGVESDWCVLPSREVIGCMEKGTEPFDRIDVILITHSHFDHFNPEIVLKHLESNEAGILICPEQVRLELEKDKRYDQVSARVMEITPKLDGRYESIDVKGVNIKVWRLKHGPFYMEDPETGRKYNKHKDVENLGFVIEVDHKRIFHGGDWGYAGRGKKANPLEEEEIDVAFLGMGAYWRLYGPDSRVIAEDTKPGHIVLMHIPTTFNLEELPEEEKKMISKTTVFRSPMEIKRITDWKNKRPTS